MMQKTIFLNRAILGFVLLQLLSFPGKELPALQAMSFTKRLQLIPHRVFTERPFCRRGIPVPSLREREKRFPHLLAPEIFSAFYTLFTLNGKYSPEFFLSESFISKIYGTVPSFAPLPKNQVEPASRVDLGIRLTSTESFISSCGSIIECCHYDSQDFIMFVAQNPTSYSKPGEKKEVDCMLKTLMWNQFPLPLFTQLKTYFDASKYFDSRTEFSFFADSRVSDSSWYTLLYLYEKMLKKPYGSGQHFPHHVGIMLYCQKEPWNKQLGRIEFFLNQSPCFDSLLLLNEAGVEPLGIALFAALDYELAHMKTLFGGYGALINLLKWPPETQICLLPRKFLPLVPVTNISFEMSCDIQGDEEAVIRLWANLIHSFYMDQSFSVLTWEKQADFFRCHGSNNPSSHFYVNYHSHLAAEDCRFACLWWWRMKEKKF